MCTTVCLKVQTVYSQLMISALLILVFFSFFPSYSLLEYLRLCWIIFFYYVGLSAEFIKVQLAIFIINLEIL